MTLESMNELDLKLNLLKGSTIKVGNLSIKPYTLDKVVEFGYTEYMNNIQLMSLTKSDFIESVDDLEKRVMLMEQEDKLTTFDFYTKLGGQEMLTALIGSLQMIFETSDVRLFANDVIAIGFVESGILVWDEEMEDYISPDEVLDTLGDRDLKLVHRGNFDELVDVIKLQNYIMETTDIKGSDGNPVDEATRRLMERMKKNAERVEQIKKNEKGAPDTEPIDISDIISAVSSKSNSINELNVWGLTLYQLYKKYSRMELIDNYEFSLKAMMKGATEIELKHWSSKL